MEPIKAHFRKFIKSFQLKRIRLKSEISNANVVLVVCAYNEGRRLRFFFDYYTKMGVDHFILIDNQSTDNSLEIAKPYENVSIFSANGSYKKSRYGVDWVNHILSSYCRGKWIIFADVDEFMTFGTNNENIPQLIAILESSGRESMQSVMLDMYSEAPGGAPRSLDDGQDPLETSPYYDASGYFIGREISSNTTWIKGGVRNRLFFDNVGSGPALNKTPLVKWKGHFAFLKSAHQLWPPHLNGTGDIPQSALLHFKFVSTSALYDLDIASRHTAEYRAYSRLGSVPSFISSSTKTYDGVHQLIDDGLISGLY